MRGAPDGRVVELVTIAHELHQVAPKGDLSEQIKPSVVLEGPKQLGGAQQCSVSHASHASLTACSNTCTGQRMKMCLFSGPAH